MKDFFIGVAFILVAIPILEEFVALVKELNAYVCTLIAAKSIIVEDKLKKSIGLESEEEEKTFLMGFHAPVGSELIEEDLEIQDDILWYL